MSIGPATSTAQLVRRARDTALPLQVQHAAFTQIVERSQHLVFSLALRTLRNADEASDVAQDAYISAWLHLRQLRDASAFTAWLKRIVETQCQRRLRCRSSASDLADLPEKTGTEANAAEHQSLLASAIADLPEGERHVTVMFYFLGHTQTEIARLLRLKPGTVGKRLYSARMKIRRRLPSSVRRSFVRLVPSRAFIDKVRSGIFDEYVGEYRFDRRPELVVTIVREGDFLVSFASGQRNVLASTSDESLLTSNYDGEGRFRRNRQGRIADFVYYEFGKRLGIARKVASPLRTS